MPDPDKKEVGVFRTRILAQKKKREDKLLQRNKKIPEGPKGAGLRALPPGVVEEMGYAATARLNPLMQLETMRPMNAMGAAAMSNPTTMTNPNAVLRRASKMSNTKVKPISTIYKQGKRRIKDKDLYKMKKVF